MSQNYPLAGIKVVELAAAVAAPVAARIMASFGATVIKIEAPPHGDSLRAMAAGQLKCSIDEGNPIFDTINTGKEIISLNLKTEKGKEVFENLLKEADVFITNIRMRSLKNMGIDYTTLKSRFPSLIYAYLSGYGQQGPDADLPGFDITAFWMRTGGATDSVEPGAQALFPSFAFGDITCGSSFLAGILMALLARSKTGKGTLISTSLFSAGMWSNSSYIIEAQGKNARNFPSSHYDTWDPFSFQYRCADGKWIAVMEKKYTDDKKIFARIFNMHELLDDPDLATLDKMALSGKGPALIRRIEEIMSTKSSQEWKYIFDKHDIANAVAQHYCEIPADTQARANGYLVDMPYFEDDLYAIPEPPIEFSEYHRKPFKKLTGFSQDTYKVLHNMGYSDNSIEQMRKDQTII